jgi:hypothetical protein
MKSIRSISILLVALGTPGVHAELMTQVEVNQTGQVFSYTLFNDEPPTSPNQLSVWHLTVNAQFSVINTPDGWDYFTDNATFIDWFNTDFELPYPHDVAPGASLGGFVIESIVATSEMLSYTVGSWDHLNDTGGPPFEGLVLAPSTEADPGTFPIPEPGSLTLLSSGLAGLLGYAQYRRRRKKQNVGPVAE